MTDLAMWGRAANSIATSRITAETPAAIHTALNSLTASRTREPPTTRTATPAAPSTGISMGYMSRLRSARFAAASPVARSAQAVTIHSNATTPARMSPITKMAAWVTSPITTTAAAKASSGGQ